jgi:hypothetical protein
MINHIRVRYPEDLWPRKKSIHKINTVNPNNPTIYLSDKILEESSSQLQRLGDKTIQVSISINETHKTLETNLQSANHSGGS